MHILSDGIVCAVLTHGESGAIARLLTPRDGLQAGYVRGGRSRRLRPVLMPGNVVTAEFRARSPDQLAALTVELVRSRAPLLAEPLAAAAVDWTTALTAATLPEGQAYPRIHAALDGVLTAIESAPSARGWASALVRFERLMLSELGFGRGADPVPLTADADWASIGAALRGNGHYLGRDLLVERRTGVLAARERLIARLRRAAG